VNLGVPASTASSGGYLQFAASGLDTLVNDDSNGSAAGGVITTIGHPQWHRPQSTQHHRIDPQRVYLGRDMARRPISRQR
jgi:hypothetical protein